MFMIGELNMAVNIQERYDEYNKIFWEGRNGK